jgi:hypothetical protein
MSRAFSATSARFIFKDARKGQVKPPHLQGALRAQGSSLIIGSAVGGLNGYFFDDWWKKSIFERTGLIYHESFYCLL